MRRKKKMLTMVAVALAVVAGIHVVSMLTVDRTIQYTETEYRSASVPESVDGYVIALVTDTHQMPEDSLQKIVDHINGRGVDVLLLGGDLGEKGRASGNMAIWAQTQTADGIYGVEGNHDDYQALFAAMQENGIHPLDNEGARLRDGLFLGGVQDAWNRKPDAELALQHAEPGDCTILLCHNPDVSMEQDTSRADLMLSGHTHGGYVTLFGVWAPAFTLPFPQHVTEYGQRFMKGWCEGAHGTAVYVSRGADSSWSRCPRVFSQPEVVLIMLRAV